MSNLYDPARVIPCKPELRFLPDGRSERVQSCWGPPQLQIYEDEHAGRLMQWVDALMAAPDVHICAVSPVDVCPLRESESPGNPLLSPHYTITVIYQRRRDEAAEDIHEAA